MNELSKESNQQYQELRSQWRAGRISFRLFHIKTIPYYEKLHRIKASQTEAEAKQAQTKGGDMSDIQDGSAA